MSNQKAGREPPSPTGGVDEHKPGEEDRLRLAAIVESSEDAIIGKDLNGIITDWNLGAQQMYGYTAREAVGRSITMLTPPELADEIPQILERLRQGEKIRRQETERMTKDGRRISVSLAIFPIRNRAGVLLGASTVVRDITQRKHAEQELRMWRDVFNHAGFGMVIAEPVTQVLQAVNPVFARMHGYTVEELVGRPLSDLLAPESRAAWTEHSRLAHERGHHVYESVHLRKDGSRFPVLTDVTVIQDECGNVLYRAAYFQDMAERKRAEAALRNSEKLATVGRIAATLAHEINNPLESVTNLVYLLAQDGSLGESARQYLTLAEEELGRITHIVRQTLGLHRDTSEPVPVNVSRILDNAVELYARKMQAQSIALERRYESEGEVKAFPGELRQVFSNLFLNALEAAGPEGKVKLHVFASRDWRRPERTGVRVIVADNGPGIPEQFRERVFEPFFTTKGEKGNGLGLWVSRGIIDKHGGSLRAHSSTRAGRCGTAFSVFIPAAELPSGWSEAAVKSGKVA